MAKSKTGDSDIKIVSFNVNGVRARLHQLQALTESQAPDVIGLQETKVIDEDFPREAIQELGYEHIEVFGQKSHYGVALLSKLPLTEVQAGVPWRAQDQQRRFISADVACGGETIRVINCYFPQGESRDHPTKFNDKVNFYQDVLRYLNEHCNRDQRLILMGDMNVAPRDADIGIGEDNKKRWLRTGKCSFLPEERALLQDVMDWGLTDSYVESVTAEQQLWSWFDYRSRGFERDPKRGLRIDLMLCTHSLHQQLQEAVISHDIRGMEKPSDHCPLWCQFGV